MPRTTRAQAKRNVVPEILIPTALPSDLPAPSTSRNLIPRSRATSLARSASKSLPGSRGSSRRSSLSGARSGDSTRHLEKKSLSESRPPTPSGTISETGPPTDTAYSGGGSQVLGPSGADTPAEGPSNVPQSQEPSSSSAVQQRRSSPRMFPLYDFDGGNSGQGEQPGIFGNNFQGQTGNGWYSNGLVDDAPQEPRFFPFDSEDAFAMRQNLSLGVNGNSNMMYNGFAPSSGPVAGSSYMHQSPSDMPPFQSSSMGPNEMHNGFASSPAPVASSSSMHRSPSDMPQFQSSSMGPNEIHNCFTSSPAPVASSSSMHRSPSDMPQFQNSSGMNMGPSEGVNGYSNTMQNGFTSSPAPVASSSSMHRSPSDVPQFQNSSGMNMGPSEGVNGYSNTIQIGFTSSPAPVASSSSMHRSPSDVPQFQNSSGMNVGSNEVNGLWYRENTDRQLRSLSSPSFNHSTMPGPENNQRGYYSGDIIPPSPPEEREMYYYSNHPANNGWPPSRPVHLAHTFDPWNPQASMDYMGSTNSSLSMNPGSATGPPMRPMTSTADSVGLRQQTPPEPAGNPIHADSGYPTDTTHFASLNQWQQPVGGGPAAQGAASGSTGGKRKRSPEDGSPSHPSSSRFIPSFHPAGEPSSQGSGRDSANEVAEQLFFSSSSQPQPDPNSGPSSQHSASIDRKGKGKARAQTPATAPSIIDITGSPPADRHAPLTTTAPAAQHQNAVDTTTDSTGRRAKPPGDPLSTYTCPICFSPPTNAAITPCGHICCGACLFAAVKTTLQRAAFGVGPRPPLSEARCPVCRAAIPGWDGKGGGVIGLKVRAVFSL